MSTVYQSRAELCANFRYAIYKSTHIQTELSDKKWLVNTAKIGELVLIQTNQFVVKQLRLRLLLCESYACRKSAHSFVLSQ